MSNNTRPVPNLQAPVAASADGKTKVFLIAPWIQFFQQFVQKTATVEAAISPYTPNANGTLIITGGTGIVLNRGSVNVNLANGQSIIPMSIGDTVSWASATSAQFFGA